MLLDCNFLITLYECWHATNRQTFLHSPLFLWTKHSVIVFLSWSASELSAVTVSRLEAAYRSLATGSHDKSFTQLKMELTREDLSLILKKCTSQNVEQDESCEGASCSPMEASPADQPEQIDADPQIQTGSVSKTASVTKKRQRYTVAQLVVEPDSQGSSQCTPAPEEMEPQVRAEEQTAAAASPAKTPPESPITEGKVVTPKWIKRRSRR